MVVWKWTIRTQEFKVENNTGKGREIIIWENTMSFVFLNCSLMLYKAKIMWNIYTTKEICLRWKEYRKPRQKTETKFCWITLALSDMWRLSSLICAQRALWQYLVWRSGTESLFQIQFSYPIDVSLSQTSFNHSLTFSKPLSNKTSIPNGI